jgi:hypothetical protein
MGKDWIGRNHFVLEIEFHGSRDASLWGSIPPLVGSIQLADISVLRLQYLSFIDSTNASNFAALVLLRRYASGIIRPANFSGDVTFRLCTLFLKLGSHYRRVSLIRLSNFYSLRFGNLSFIDPATLCFGDQFRLRFKLRCARFQRASLTKQRGSSAR